MVARRYSARAPTGGSSRGFRDSREAESVPCRITAERFFLHAKYVVHADDEKIVSFRRQAMLCLEGAVSTRSSENNSRRRRFRARLLSSVGSLGGMTLLKECQPQSRQSPSLPVGRGLQPRHFGIVSTDKTCTCHRYGGSTRNKVCISTPRVRALRTFRPSRVPLRQITPDAYGWGRVGLGMVCGD